MTDFMKPPYPQFLQQQDIPANGRPESPLKLQNGLTQTGMCNFAVQDSKLLKSEIDDPFSVRLNASPELICPLFMIEVVLAPAPQNQPTAEQLRRNNELRMQAVFLAYDEKDPRQYGGRKVSQYTSRINPNPPTERVSFSPQLIDVQYRRGDHTDTPKSLLHPQVPSEKQHYFSWNAKRCALLNRGMPLGELSAASLTASEWFVQMIDEVTKESKRIHVVLKSAPRIADVFWVRFASIPAPVPESQFLWMSPLDSAEPFEIM